MYFSLTVPLLNQNEELESLFNIHLTDLGHSEFFLVMHLVSN